MATTSGVWRWASFGLPMGGSIARVSGLDYDSALRLVAELGEANGIDPDKGLVTAVLMAIEQGRLKGEGARRASLS